LDKAEVARTTILGEIADGQVDTMRLDLADLSSVNEFAQAFLTKYDRLDVLVNNAGIMWVPYAKTKDGFESQFGTNHLGHFALTGLLLERLVATPRSRVVNVSSNGHRSGEMDFDNLMFEGGEGYGRHAAYGRTKLANLLFTYELQRKLDAIGSESMALAAHPGISDTDLDRYIREFWYVRMLRPLFSFMVQSAAMGALPTIRAATDPDAKGGEYYGPDGFMERGGYPVVVESSEDSHSEGDAEKLWNISEELTGVHYDWDRQVVGAIPA
jgi:NAD(P)-dependent dehydrogenase (short-subunit alcohol dehydrogenase family)